MAQPEEVVPQADMAAAQVAVAVTVAVLRESQAAHQFR
jgi:hypothetical protein